MILEVKLRKVGNSLGIVFPKEAIAHMNVAEGDILYLTETPETGYRVTPGNPEFARKVQAAEHLSRRYRDVLRELAR